MWIRLTELFRKLISEVGADYQKERLVIFKEEDVGGPEMVTIDEDRVLRGGWIKIKLQT